jgi:hypothetical protein
MELWATIFTPASYQFTRRGLMSHVPLVDDLVDFKALNEIKATRFYLNAFSLSRRRLRILDNWLNRDINLDTYNGAQAMYMLFPPVQTEDDLLMTGATRDPTGLQAIWMKERANLSRVLALDPLPQCFWRKPTDVYDAFQLMVMNPIVHLQQLTFALYAQTDWLVNSGAGTRKAGALGLNLPRLETISPTIPETHYSEMLRWTHENAMILHKAGYEAARPLAQALSTARTASQVESAFADRRYYTAALPSQMRSQQFLSGVVKPVFSRFDEFVRDLSSSPATSLRTQSRLETRRRAGSRRTAR